MNSTSFESYPMDKLDLVRETPTTEWLWHGYIARGNLTLLTSLWKAGKTTLVTGLLQHLANGQTFLGRACSASRTLVISEESRQHWRERLRTMPVESGSRLLPRPFLGRPTSEQWQLLVDHAI